MEGTKSPPPSDPRLLEGARVASLENLIRRLLNSTQLDLTPLNLSDHEHALLSEVLAGTSNGGGDAKNAINSPPPLDVEGINEGNLAQIDPLQDEEEDKVKIKVEFILQEEVEDGLGEYNLDDREPEEYSEEKKIFPGSPPLFIFPSSSLIPSLPNPFISLGPALNVLDLAKYSKPPIRRGKGRRGRGRPYSCPHCKYTSRAKRKYEEHLHIHSGERPWLCSLCGKTFRTKGGMLGHVAAHSHPTPTFPCHLCMEEFPRRDKLQSHINRKHKDPRRKCDICQAIFACSVSLHLHKKRMHAERGHVCGICGHAYSLPYQLKDHLKSHSDPEKESRLRGPKVGPASILNPPSEEVIDMGKEWVEPPSRYGCEVEGCGKSFPSQKLLQGHTWKRHWTAEEKRVECPICHKFLKDKHKLKMHGRLVHSEVRPHICSLCGQGFKVAENLKRHEKGHSTPGWKPRANCKPKIYPPKKRCETEAKGGKEENTETAT